MTSYNSLTSSIPLIDLMTTELRDQTRGQMTGFPRWAQ